VISLSQEKRKRTSERPGVSARRWRGVTPVEGTILCEEDRREEAGLGKRENQKGESDSGPRHKNDREMMGKEERLSWGERKEVVN